MKRVGVLTLLVVLSGWPVLATAQRLSMEESARQSQKADKKQQKMYSKAAKNQQKAIKKYEKAQQKAQRKAAKQSNHNGKHTV
jgi:hypothetical protein